MQYGSLGISSTSTASEVVDIDHKGGGTGSLMEFGEERGYDRYIETSLYFSCTASHFYISEHHINKNYTFY
ncbi:MAG: hypothetical protein MIO93_11610 [ANME-2 cluster archaeon]|jgi:hypothetical protein|nr:hypothetical protein [ANME-2 cluster archaeon]